MRAECEQFLFIVFHWQHETCLVESVFIFFLFLIFLCFIILCLILVATWNSISFSVIHSNGGYSAYWTTTFAFVYLKFNWFFSLSWVEHILFTVLFFSFILLDRRRNHFVSFGGLNNSDGVRVFTRFARLHCHCSWDFSSLRFHWNVVYVCVLVRSSIWALCSLECDTDFYFWSVSFIACSSSWSNFIIYIEVEWKKLRGTWHRSTTEHNGIAEKLQFGKVKIIEKRHMDEMVSVITL